MGLMEHKVLLLVLLSCFLCLSQGGESGTYLDHFCEKGKFKSLSYYQINVNILLFRKFYEQSPSHFYYNITTGDKPDQVHGHYLCRGDLSGDECKSCVDKAAQEILVRRCRKRKSAMIWYEGCFIRYARVSFTSIMRPEPDRYIWSNGTVKVPVDKFDDAVIGMLQNLTDSAVTNRQKSNYAANELGCSDSLKIYGFVQCTADISASDCKTCLEKPIRSLFSSVQGKEGVHFLGPSCNFGYDIHPF